MSIWFHKDLIFSLAYREIQARYRGSVMGMGWALAQPFLIFLAYYFVFGLIFQIKWNQETPANFAVVLFAGLIIFNYFAEVANKSPLIIISNPSYISKVVFPVLVLPWVTQLVALFNFLLSLFVLTLMNFFIGGALSETVFLLPIIVLPFFVFCLGISYLLAALGVYLRDSVQVVTLLTTVMLFLTPIFYPIEMVPESLQIIVKANPLTVPVEFTRDVLIWGNRPDWMTLSLYLGLASVFFYFCYGFFKKVSVGFADVL